MIQNDTFKFVVHRENFLSLSQCQKLMRYLETGEPTESELAGNYDENILNKEVRDNKEVTIDNEKLNNKLKMIFELSKVLLKFLKKRSVFFFTLPSINLDPSWANLPLILVSAL